MDGITNTYHTSYFIDLVNKGSQLIPALFIPVPEKFIFPEERRHRYVPGSQEAYATVFGLYFCLKRYLNKEFKVKGLLCSPEKHLLCMSD